MEHQITPQDRRRIATAVGVSEQYLYQCLTGRRDMDPVEARRIEDQTSGVLTRKMLCQRRWRGIWPELATEEANSKRKPAPALTSQAQAATQSEVV